MRNLFLGIDKGECEMFDYFENPFTAPIEVTVSNKNLDTPSYCGNGYCTRLN